jgi:glyoxylase-like metal-dependent hydrolase (beta-lactamase superfamily II)
MFMQSPKKMSSLSRIQGILRGGIFEIVPGFYQITYRGVNLFLIVEEELTLIDTGFYRSPRRIVDHIRTLGRSPEELSLIVLTHNHFDHAGGVAELRQLTRARVAIHKADVPAYEQPLYPRFLKRAFDVRPIASLRSAFALNPADIDIHLAGGEVLKPIGGLRVVYTPGHTPGSICLFSPRKRILIAGDTMSRTAGSVWLPHKTVSTNMRLAIGSIEEMAKLDFDILCFGHGHPLLGGARAEVQQMLAKIKGRDF